MINIEGFVIKSEADIERITHTSEQQFVRALLTRPHLKITHEKDIFWADAKRKTDDRTLEPVTVGHCPDFIIENLNNEKAGPIYVEITQMEYDPKTEPPEQDPKWKHREVMKRQPDTGRYVVIYHAGLRKIEKATGIPIIDDDFRQNGESPKPVEQKYVFPDASGNNT